MQPKTDREYVIAYSQLMNACDTIYHNAAVKAGISDCAFRILYAMQDTQHIYTQSEIGDSASLPRQTVNSALKKLEKDGLLTLQRTEGRTGKTLHLTDLGSAFVQKHIAPVAAAEERVCSMFSESEKNAFIETLRLLTARLKTETESITTEEK